jgi:hypothetical protein
VSSERPRRAARPAPTPASSQGRWARHRGRDRPVPCAREHVRQRLAAVVGVVGAREVPRQIVTLPDEHIGAAGDGEHIAIGQQPREAPGHDPRRGGDERQTSAGGRPQRWCDGQRRGDPHERIGRGRQPEGEAGDEQTPWTQRDERRADAGERPERAEGREGVDLDPRRRLPDRRVQQKRRGDDRGREPRSAGGGNGRRLGGHRGGEAQDGEDTQRRGQGGEQVESEERGEPRQAREEPAEHRVQRLSRRVTEPARLRDHRQLGAVEQAQVSLHRRDETHEDHEERRPRGTCLGQGQAQRARRCGHGGQRAAQSRMRRTRAGLPTATAYAGISRGTTAPAPICAPRPMRTPGEDDRADADVDIVLDDHLGKHQRGGQNRGVSAGLSVGRGQDADEGPDPHGIADPDAAGRVHEHTLADPRVVADLEAVDVVTLQHGFVAEVDVVAQRHRGRVPDADTLFDDHVRSAGGERVAREVAVAVAAELSHGGTLPRAGRFGKPQARRTVSADPFSSGASASCGRGAAPRQSPR